MKIDLLEIQGCFRFQQGESEPAVFFAFGRLLLVVRYTLKRFLSGRMFGISTHLGDRPYTFVHVWIKEG
jgi:hypothetical protein